MFDRDNLIDLVFVVSYYDVLRVINFKLFLVVFGGKVWMIIIMINWNLKFYRLVY